MVVVDEAQVALVEPPFPLDEHPARPVDEDFRDAGIAQEDLQRAEAGEFVDHLFGQAVQFVAGDRQLMARAVFADLFRDVLTTAERAPSSRFMPSSSISSMI